MTDGIGTTAERLWNPLDPAFRANPYPFYDRLRTEAPVYRVSPYQVVLTRYSDVFATLRSAEVSRDVEANALFDETDELAVRRRTRRRGDPAVFDDPHALRLDRDNAGRHTAFAAGIHYCLGASLAKLEAGIAITRLIRGFETIELAGEPHWRDRITIRGVDRLPLTLS